MSLINLYFVKYTQNVSKIISDYTCTVTEITESLPILGLPAQCGLGYLQCLVDSGIERMNPFRFLAGCREVDYKPCSVCPLS